jgi:hypothetical protein
METKELLNEKVAKLKEKHDSIKAEMLKILDASRILNEQYSNLEKELYLIEDEYVDTMKKIIE